MKIADILSPERIAVGAKISSKKAVLEELARLVALANSRLTAAAVFDSLLARERLGSTALGSGIAIPHGRLSFQDHTVGAFLRIDKGVDYDAVDNNPVDLFFALSVPDSATEEHLQLLATLARAFSDETLLKNLRSAGSVAAIYDLLIQPAYAE